MKNLVKTFAIAGLLFASSLTAFAIDKDKDKLNNAVVENVVDAYINSSVKGDVEHVDNLFADNFSLKYNTEYNQAPLSKSSYIKQIKGQKGVTFNCDSDYQIVEKAGKYSLAKVTLNFSNFKRTDYLTMVQDNEGWKITEVNSVFEQK
ncbi:nuclear transport factor 2 family protein [Sphingobacterium cellulitidis]|uniref:nuclear transport factor 2 family protein n=1 Tax=Sphingobacterium cellulitidis TaxID=1768011 RepID=UPI003C7DFD32